MSDISHNPSCITVLLVEDNPGDIILIREALKTEHLLLDIYEVSDGVAAMEFLHKTGEYKNAPNIEFILLDLNLPKKNGFDVIREIRADENLKHLPIAVLTSSKAERDILESYRLSANCFIPKPLKLNDFISVVQNMSDFWFTIVKIPARKNGAIYG